MDKNEKITMMSLQPPLLYKTASKSIVDAELINRTSGTGSINSLLQGKALSEFASTLDMVELIFDDIIKLTITPQDNNMPMQFSACNCENESTCHMGKYLNDMNINIIKNDGTMSTIRWNAHALLENRIGMTYKNLFFNGEYLFLYWEASDITGFKSAQNGNTGQKLLYWFDTD